MRLRFPSASLAAILVAAAALSLAPAHVWAQTEEPPGATDKLPNPPDKLPKAPKGDRNRNVDFLFDALKAAPDADIAKQVEGRIWAIWLASGSDTADLLMSRVKAAIEAKDTKLAIQLLGSIIDIKPDYIEAWNRRATLFFALKDYGRAMTDIQEVLNREPRHFGALAGLGMILEEVGEDKQALDAYRKALAVNPHMQKIPEHVKALTEKVEGRDI
ncbi:MAG: tetratricopeptide repeat protein [Alphaproteobacteria bacterium]|nr:tetratricopeptide repeat protein [Alphaproteobacteria bacterium]